MKTAVNFFHNLTELTRSRLARKMALPVIAVLSLFMVPVLAGFWDDKVTDDSIAEVARHNEGVVALNEMSLAMRREQLAYHKIMFALHTDQPQDPQVIQDFRQASADVEHWYRMTVANTDQIDHAGDGQPHEEILAVQQECEVLHQRAAELFNNGVAPLVSSPQGMDRESLLTLDAELASVYERIFDLRVDWSQQLITQRESALQSQTDSRQRASQMFFWATLGAVFMGILLVAFSTRKFLNPINDLVTASHDLSLGDLSGRVKVSGNDELSNLGNTFNYMASSLQARTSQLEAEQARIRSIHQSIADGIVVTDSAGTIVSVNPAGEVALGIHALKLEGKTGTGIVQIDEILHANLPQTSEMVKCWEAKNCEKKDCPSHGSDDRRCWLQCGTFCYDEIQGTFRQKRDACERCQVFQANAARDVEVKIGDKYYSVALVPILDDEGQEEGRTLVLHDITDIQRAKEEIQRRSSELEVLNNISEAISRSLDLQTTLDVALQEVVEVRQADAAFIHLLDDKSGLLALSVSTGIPLESIDLIDNLPRGVGCPGHVLESGESTVEDDLTGGKDVPAEILAAGLVAAVSVPLKSKHAIIGTLTLLSKERAAFTDDDARVLTLIGSQIGVAIDNATMYGESVEHAMKENARSRIASVLTASLDLGQVFDAFSEETRKLVDFDRISIVVPHGEKDLRSIVVRGDDSGTVYEEGAILPRQDTGPGWVMDNQRSYITGDLDNNEDFNSHANLRAAGFRSWMSLPLILNNEAMGTLNLASLKPGAFDTGNVVEMRPIANQLALALANQKLFGEVTNAKTEWETTFDSVSEGIAIVSAKHEVLRLNRAAAEMVGGRLEDLVGRKCYEVIHGACEVSSTCPMSDLSTNSPCRSEQEFPDGRTLEVLVDPMIDANGKRLGAVHFLRDVTEAKRLRQQLVQSEKMVAVGQLVSGVAHEINNPLTGVMGYAQLLLARDLDDRTRHDLQQICNEAERATKIVRHLLSFARKHTPERGPIDVNTVIMESLELKAYDLKVNNIRVVTQLDKTLPLTSADSHQLQQVFLNLITNSQQAILDDEAYGVINITTHAGDGRIEIAISDSGPGVPLEIRDRIFDPFFTTKDVGKGTGLGLSVCYGVVEEHGGKIYLDSGFQEGTRIVIELPVTSASPVPAKVKEISAPPYEASLSGNILLVDDEATIREVLRQTLNQVGHSVDTASNGHVALKMMKQKHYDCVVSDVKMPVVDGPTLHRTISEIDPEMAGAFIFISGDTISPETRSYVASTGNPYLAKPFQLDELEAQLKKILQQRKN